MVKKEKEEEVRFFSLFKKFLALCSKAQKWLSVQNTIIHNTHVTCANCVLSIGMGKKVFKIRGNVHFLFLFFYVIV